MGKDFKKKITEYIKLNFLKSEGSIDGSVSLFERQVIDSFGLIELIAFIEKEFSVRLSPSDVAIENFDSIDKIVKLIEKRIRV